MKTDIAVTREERGELEALVANRNTPAKVVWRAEIVLATADGNTVKGICRLTGKSKPCVWRWQARFAAFLKRSPDTATADEVKTFQLHLIENGASIPNRNRIMTGVKFLLKVTLRRHDLAAEIYHLKEPQKVPVVMSGQEISGCWRWQSRYRHA